MNGIRCGNCSNPITDDTPMILIQGRYQMEPFHETYEGCALAESIRNSYTRPYVKDLVLTNKRKKHKTLDDTDNPSLENAIKEQY